MQVSILEPSLQPRVTLMRFLLLPPIVLVASAGIMLALHLNWPIANLVPSPVNWGGLVAATIGLGIAIWHARLFRRVGTNINTFGDPDKLTTEGLFTRTRNPMYLGMVVCLIGVAWALGSLSPWAGPLAFFALANFWYVPLEERAMARKFGSAYAQYQLAVSRWL
jgi:protein-S-isoprenylcysteine O-methyltransferase Ste14